MLLSVLLCFTVVVACVLLYLRLWISKTTWANRYGRVCLVLRTQRKAKPLAAPRNARISNDNEPRLVRRTSIAVAAKLEREKRTTTNLSTTTCMYAGFGG